MKRLNGILTAHFTEIVDGIQQLPYTAGIILEHIYRFPIVNAYHSENIQTSDSGRSTIHLQHPETLFCLWIAACHDVNYFIFTL